MLSNTLGPYVLPMAWILCCYFKVIYLYLQHENKKRD